MKSSSSVLLLVMLALVVPVGDAAACGDKLLVIGRGAQRVQKAKYPAAILLVLPADTDLATAARDMKLEATLRRAGHTVETLSARTPLREWLATRRYDFVVTGLEAAGAAIRDAAASASAPGVIPMMLKAEAATRQAVEKQYGVLIQAPTRSLAYLGAIDADMGRRRTSASHP
jgi:hypothetical protein